MDWDRRIESTDSVVRSIIGAFVARAELGKSKYGVTLDRTDLSTLDWIQHAQEELMDGILYLEKLKRTFTETAPQTAVQTDKKNN